MKPREAFLAVTYRCNARCEMCGIWSGDKVSELDPKHFGKLPSSLRTVNITGGEPFLRDDLIDIVAELHAIAPTSRIVISTNGLLTDKIVDTTKSLVDIHPRLGIGVSIDGLEATHDRIRGVNGAFRRASATIGGLRESGVRDLRIGMTILPVNIGEITSVLKLSHDMGVQFTTTFAHNSEIYFQKVDNPSPEFTVDSNQLRAVVRTQLQSKSIKDWLRAYHTQGVLDPTIRAQFVSRCEAGSRYFFMAPDGSIFPCMVLNKKLGNIADFRNWDEFTGSIDERDLRRVVSSCRLECWMVCNTRSLIMAHPLRAGWWVVKNKIISSTLH